MLGLCHPLKCKNRKYNRTMKHLVNSYFTGTADYRPRTFQSER
jgi:hypothetical protein